MAMQQITFKEHNKFEISLANWVFTLEILGDLQGPKIRIAKFAEGRVNLVEGQTFVLDSRHPSAEGHAEIVGLDYTELPEMIVRGDTLLLDDGRIRLLVSEVNQHSVVTEGGYWWLIYLITKELISSVAE